MCCDEDERDYAIEAAQWYDEQEFIAECASRCVCCTTCHQQFPCAGVMQGASCDAMCACNQEDGGDY